MSGRKFFGLRKGPSADLLTWFVKDRKVENRDPKFGADATVARQQSGPVKFAVSHLVCLFLLYQEVCNEEGGDGEANLNTSLVDTLVLTLTICMTKN